MKCAIPISIIAMLCISSCDGESSTEPDEVAVAIGFAALIGDDAFACGQSYEVGDPVSTLTASDLRFYVHDLRLVDADGVEHAVALDQASPWQHAGVVLLDFEDGSEGCESGSELTNTVATGSVPEGAYDELRFTLGVPFDLNHENQAIAESPLNLSTMFWSWQAGYKFLRFDGSTPGLGDTFRVHLGSTGCEFGEGTTTIARCARNNRPEVSLEFDPDGDVVIFDLAALLSSFDVDANHEGSAPGCMSEADDTDCESVFEGLGLSSSTGDPASEQVVFRAQER